MEPLDALIPIAALIPAGWLLWHLIRSVVSPLERRHIVAAWNHDPILFILMAGATGSVVAFLLWIGTLGALPFGKSLIGMIGFGLAALIWHETHSRKRHPR
ncbi:hypothetical protein [Achromobacter xylosoxidans]|uniref:hypothetical protein n=1 Tax=Alcaligenes xylosoxydans xylosoxydans TaxID=85698 RepID=UPI0011876B30|nr:hypothetical protein [Achromobacter xylosoxidans]